MEHTPEGHVLPTRHPLHQFYFYYNLFLFVLVSCVGEDGLGRYCILHKISLVFAAAGCQFVKKKKLLYMYYTHCGHGYLRCILLRLRAEQS